jgi:hypothetical protein
LRKNNDDCYWTLLFITIKIIRVIVTDVTVAVRVNHRLGLRVTGSLSGIHWQRLGLMLGDIDVTATGGLSVRVGIMIQVSVDIFIGGIIAVAVAVVIVAAVIFFVIDRRESTFVISKYLCSRNYFN